MKARIIKFELPYVIIDDETNEVIGFEGSGYRARQEAANLGATEIEECTGSTLLSIMPTSALEAALASGSSEKSSEDGSPSEKASSSEPSGRGRGSSSSKTRGKASPKG